MQLVSQEVHKLVQNYFDAYAGGQIHLPNFLLLKWPKDIGKSDFVISVMKNFLGDAMGLDFLHVRDLTLETWKFHSLKISLPDDSSKQFISLSEQQVYEDIWVREICAWLQQSASSKHKVVLIENIERMTISGANAFLKTAEEALPWRIIIATTSNAAALLDTMLSRALIFSFGALTEDELYAFCDERGVFVGNQETRKLLVRMSLGRPWLLLRYAKLFEQEEGFVWEFIGLLGMLQSGENVFKSHRLLLRLQEHGLLDWFLEAWIGFAAEQNRPDLARTWLDVKQKMESNVAVPHLLMSGLI